MPEATQSPTSVIPYEAKPAAHGVWVERRASQISVIVPMLGGYAPMPQTDLIKTGAAESVLLITSLLFLSRLIRIITGRPNPPLAVFIFLPATFAVTLTSRTGQVRQITCPREHLEALYVQHQPPGVALRIAGRPAELLLPNTQSSLLISLHEALRKIADEVGFRTHDQPT